MASDGDHYEQENAIRRQRIQHLQMMAQYSSPTHPINPQGNLQQSESSFKPQILNISSVGSHPPRRHQQLPGTRLSGPVRNFSPLFSGLDDVNGAEVALKQEASRQQHSLLSNNPIYPQQRQPMASPLPLQNFHFQQSQDFLDSAPSPLHRNTLASQQNSNLFSGHVPHQQRPELGQHPIMTQHGGISGSATQVTSFSESPRYQQEHRRVMIEQQQKQIAPDTILDVMNMSKGERISSTLAGLDGAKNSSPSSDGNQQQLKQVLLEDMPTQHTAQHPSKPLQHSKRNSLEMAIESFPRRAMPTNTSLRGRSQAREDSRSIGTQQLFSLDKNTAQSEDDGFTSPFLRSAPAPGVYGYENSQARDILADGSEVIQDQNRPERMNTISLAALPTPLSLMSNGTVLPPPFRGAIRGKSGVRKKANLRQSVSTQKSSFCFPFPSVERSPSDLSMNTSLETKGVIGWPAAVQQPANQLSVDCGNGASPDWNVLEHTSLSLDQKGRLPIPETGDCEEGIGRGYHPSVEESLPCQEWGHKQVNTENSCVESTIAPALGRKSNMDTSHQAETIVETASKASRHSEPKLDIGGHDDASLKQSFAFLDVSVSDIDQCSVSMSSPLYLEKKQNNGEVLQTSPGKPHFASSTDSLPSLAKQVTATSNRPECIDQMDEKEKEKINVGFCNDVRQAGSCTASAPNSTDDSTGRTANSTSEMAQSFDFKPYRTTKRRGGQCQIDSKAAATFLAWINEPKNIKHPYPTPDEKQSLARLTGVPQKSVDVWFTNFRQRKWKKEKNNYTAESETMAAQQTSNGGTKEENSTLQQKSMEHSEANCSDNDEILYHQKGQEVVLETLQHGWPEGSRQTLMFLIKLVHDERRSEENNGTSSFSVADTSCGIFPNNGSAKLTNHSQATEGEVNVRANDISSGDVLNVLFNPLDSDHKNSFLDNRCGEIDEIAKDAEMREIGSKSTMKHLMCGSVFKGFNYEGIELNADLKNVYELGQPLLLIAAVETERKNCIESDGTKQVIGVSIVTDMGRTIRHVLSKVMNIDSPLLLDSPGSAEQNEGGTSNQHSLGCLVNSDTSENSAADMLEVHSRLHGNGMGRLELTYNQNVVEHSLGPEINCFDLGGTASFVDSKTNYNSVPIGKQSSLYRPHTFLNVESWVAALPWMNGEDRDFDSSREPLSSSWECKWKKVLVRIPLKASAPTTCEKASLSSSPRQAVPTNKKDNTTASINEGTKLRGFMEELTITREHGAIFWPSMTFYCPSTNSPQTANGKHAIFGFQPLEFFRREDNVRSSVATLGVVHEHGYSPHALSSVAFHPKNRLSSSEIGKSLHNELENEGERDQNGSSNILLQHPEPENDVTASDNASQIQTNIINAGIRTDDHQILEDHEAVVQKNEPPTSRASKDIEMKMSCSAMTRKVNEFESWRYLRDMIQLCSSHGREKHDVIDLSILEDGTPANVTQCEKKPMWIENDHPHAPLSELWIMTISKEPRKLTLNADHQRAREFLDSSSDTDLRSSQHSGQTPRELGMTVVSSSALNINAGGSLLGRRWVWDEGFYTDGNCVTKLRMDKNDDADSTTTKKIKQSGLVSTPLSTLPFESDSSLVPTTSGHRRFRNRAYCNCGRSPDYERKQGRGFLSNTGNMQSSRTRRSERSGTSVSMSNVLSELASGKLNPHTLIACEDYAEGPEFRFIRGKEFHSLAKASDNLSLETAPMNNAPLIDDADQVESSDHFCTLLARCQANANALLLKSPIQPFAVRVSPDAAFLTDLHAHLSNSEVIGFLGGQYIPSERCIYIQAAFPCKSTLRADSGFTDVEMDPVSQIVAGDAIVGHGMMVVGWYHSHPTFQPDPSVTDIENQGNYQRLFQSVLEAQVASKTADVSSEPSALSHDNNACNVKDGVHRKKLSKKVGPLRASRVEESRKKYFNEDSRHSVCPFVGLIVGTYDGRNPTSQSVMRWFHVTKKDPNSHKISNPLLNVIGGNDGSTVGKGDGRPIPRSDLSRQSDLSRTDGQDRVFFPMNLQVTHRKFRNIHVEQSSLSINTQSKQDFLQEIRRNWTMSGTRLRREVDSLALEYLLKGKKASTGPFCNSENRPFSGPKARDVLPDSSDLNLRKAIESDDRIRIDCAETDLTNDATPKVATKLENSEGSIQKKHRDKNPSKNSGQSDETVGTLNAAQTAISPEHESLVIQLRMPPDSLSAFAYGVHISRYSLTNLKLDLANGCLDSETRANLVSATASSHPSDANSEFVHVSDLLGNNNDPSICQDEKEASTFSCGHDGAVAPAHPLSFTREELAILRMGFRDGVTEDVCAGIIWHAVEREQKGSVRTDNNVDKPKLGLYPKTPPPASSLSILELLLFPTLSFLSIDDQTAEMSSFDDFANFLQPKPSLNDLSDDDAVLVHSIDVVLSHYANDSHRMNPFESWSGAGDKGFVGKDSAYSTSSEHNSNEDFRSSWWRTYYWNNILGAKATGGNGNTGKMKRGHKLCACLLKWARHMQLYSGYQSDSTRKTSNLIGVDNEKIFFDRPPLDMGFVAEVMRLLAARWRESSASKKRRNAASEVELGETRKRGRPPLSLNTKGKAPRPRGRPRLYS